MKGQIEWPMGKFSCIFLRDVRSKLKGLYDEDA